MPAQIVINPMPQICDICSSKQQDTYTLFMERIGIPSKTNICQDCLQKLQATLSNTI